MVPNLQGMWQSGSIEGVVAECAEGVVAECAEGVVAECAEDYLIGTGGQRGLTARAHVGS